MFGNASPLSVEIWPARTPEQHRRLDRVCDVLAQRRMRFVSVTYGAGGSRRDLSLDLVKRCVADGLTVYVHLVVVGHSRAELLDLISQAVDLGASGVVALRGDPPDGGGPLGELHNAGQLVDMVAGKLPVAVAVHPRGHPESPDAETDFRFLLDKLGRASFGITQFYTEPEHYRDLVDRIRNVGCRVPVVPGILVPLSPNMLVRMGEMAKIAIPFHLSERFSRSEQNGCFQQEALAWALELARDALGAGAPWIHLFSMNSPRVIESFSDALKGVVETY